MKFWKRRRRTYIVDESLQYRFLAILFIYCFIITIFILSFLFVPEFIKLNDQSLSLEVRAVAADRILMLHSRVWPAFISLIVILGLHSILLFHRIVGPLYRFRLAFEQIRQGNVSFRVKLRKKDYLHDEEEAFNNMIEGIAAKFKVIKTTSLDSLNSLYDLEKQSSCWTDTDRERLRVHREHLSKLADILENL